MQKLLTTLIIFLIGINTANAQANFAGNLPDGNLPTENLYMHLNTSTLFVGEYLLYKIYTSEARTNQLSTISKVAYVNMVDQNGEVVLQQTVNLKNGIGTGDFFLPTSVSSGNYKLLAYTNWMRNNTDTKFFSQDIFVINPYTSQQNIISTDSTITTSVSLKSSNSNAIQLDKQSYGYREKISAKINSLEEGSYSISVRQVDSIPNPELQSATTYYQETGNSNLTKESVKYLPELRGKLISGLLKPLNNSGVKTENIDLSLSVPGDDYFFRIGNTNKDGRFYFNIDENFADEDVIVQVIGERKDAYEIILDEDQISDFANLKFSDYKIAPSLKSSIVKRSVNNQIENAYFSLKPDTIKSSKRANIFDGLDPVVYQLDDYTRFKTVAETFVEIIPVARVRRNGDSYEFAVLGKEPYNDFKGSPLVVVDGILLQDTDDFITGFDSYRIKSVKVVRDKYFIGSMYFKGAIMIETLNQDFADDYQREYLKEFKLNSGSLKKQYFKQNYSGSSNYENIPDRRVQLLWNPDFVLEEDGKVDFYTSDIAGLYEISIQGITKSGRPVSLIQTFKVE